MKKMNLKEEAYPTSSIIQTKRGPACRSRMRIWRVWWTLSKEISRIRLIKAWKVATINCHKGVSVPKPLPFTHSLIDPEPPNDQIDTATAIWSLRGPRSSNQPLRMSRREPRLSSASWVCWEASNSRMLTYWTSLSSYSGTTRSCNKP